MDTCKFHFIPFMPNIGLSSSYRPHDGHVTFGEVVEGVARAFNMGADLATVLAVFATLSDGDILTESWYLGTEPGSSHFGGLNRHSTVEADISPNKEDFYLGCGDNHHISSRMFKQNVNIVKNSASKQFDIPAMRQQYLLNSKFSQANNPYLYYFPFPSIVSVVAYNFYPAFFSNGTYGLGGVANYESISKIVGANLTETGDFEYVPERWPEQGWYRRALPYGAVEALVTGFTTIYPANPVPMLVSQLATPKNLNLNTIICDVYQGVQSITPLGFTGNLADASAAVAWAAAKLDLLAPGTIAGCPKNVISNNMYPDGKGSPNSPPPSVVANTGNNVYNKVYFKNTPTTPQCNHVSNP